jgi:Protein of unknown function (DUF3632)
MENRSFVNMSAFVARLAVAGVTYRYALQYVIWGMRDGLETEHGFRLYRDWIYGATMWIFCAGQWVFERVVQYPKPIDEWIARAYKVGPLHTGPIFGMERWKFWQKAFEAAAESAPADDECRKNVLKVANLMDAIAQCCKW